MTTTAPTVPVKRRTDVHLVVDCPFCHREHAHGAGGGLGLRLSHCIGQPSCNYELVDPKESS